LKNTPNINWVRAQGFRGPRKAGFFYDFYDLYDKHLPTNTHYWDVSCDITTSLIVRLSLIALDQKIQLGYKKGICPSQAPVKQVAARLGTAVLGLQMEWDTRWDFSSNLRGDSSGSLEQHPTEDGLDI